LHAKILCAETDALKFHCAFVRRNYFCFAGAESRLVLANGFPINGPPGPANSIPRHAAEFE
jgi:hypothetical protein